MKTLSAMMRQFLLEEDGPTAVEYAVMLALIIVICVTVISNLGRSASRTFDRTWDGIRYRI